MDTIVTDNSCTSSNENAASKVERKDKINIDDSNVEHYEEEQELWFLNYCMSKAEQVHVLVCNSLCTKEQMRTHNEEEELTNGHPSSTLELPRWARSSLLNDDVQQYLRYLLHKYRDGKLTQRRKVLSSRCFYFLECLTNETLRDEFILAASSTKFVDL